MNRHNLERRKRAEEFLRRNEGIVNYVFKVDFHRGHKSPSGRELIMMAREELGYSPKTYSGDIFTTLRGIWKEIL